MTLENPLLQKSDNDKNSKLKKESNKDIYFVWRVFASFWQRAYMCILQRANDNAMIIDGVRQWYYSEACVDCRATYTVRQYSVYTGTFLLNLVYVFDWAVEQKYKEPGTPFF